MAQKRRRGAELEHDILVSTLTLIKKVPYEKITMDMIATEAQTNKSVLYRRWNSKADIIIAALRTQLSDITYEEPNTGNLRDDLIALFQFGVSILARLDLENMAGLLQERIGGINLQAYNHIKDSNYVSKAVHHLVQHAAKRGELDENRLDDIAYHLPMLVIFHLLLTDPQSMTESRLTQVVDTILMPVFNRATK